MTVSERIFDLLKKQGKKQGDLARALNVRPTTVSEWKTGKREPSAVFYAKIAEYFGVSLDYLITGRPPRDAPVQQIIGNNNSNNIANVAGNVGGDLTEYERELLKVCESFDMRHKTALLFRLFKGRSGRRDGSFERNGFSLFRKRNDTSRRKRFFERKNGKQRKAFGRRRQGDGPARCPRLGRTRKNLSARPAPAL